MKVAIITNIGIASSRILATALRDNDVNAEVFDMRKTDDYDFRGFDWVFSYGCSADTMHNNRLNKRQAVKTCVSKPRTFDALQAAKCNTVEYSIRKPLPKNWDWVVIRDKIDGNKAQGLNYCKNDDKVPEGALYSEYFEHKYEYRIMVFNGKVIGRYFKREVGDEWQFNIQPAAGFELMDKHCLKAAKALGIDYAGFDVVANTKKDFKILEANSSPRITDEAETAIVEFFINL